MAPLPKANRIILSKAKKAFPYEVMDAEFYSVHHAEPYLHGVLFLDKNKYKIAFDNVYKLTNSAHDDNEEDKDLWKVDIAKLKEAFSPCKIPSEIIKLAQYQNRRNSTLTSFYLCSEENEEDNELYSEKFVLFGCCHDDGSLFGYWKTDKLLSACPIVRIDHDIEDSQVLANNIKQFLQLVAAGDRWIEAWDDEYIAEKSKHEQDLEIDYNEKKECKKLERWLLKNLEIPATRNAQRILDKAFAKHGDVGAWLSKQVR